MNKPGVIFVGSFLEKAKDGSVGGQMFACRSIIHSDLAREINFSLIDSTAESVPAPPVYKRLGKVVKRLFNFLLALFKRNNSAALIFTSSGLSFLEKGLMVILSSWFGKTTILAPRSGLSKDDYYHSKFYKWFIPLVIRKADKVICQGNSWKKFYAGISGADEKKFIVIQNWIDMLPYKNLHLDSNLKSNTDPIRILYLGWLETYKGIFDLIEAINILKTRHSSFKLKICGMGSAKERMIGMIEEKSLTGCIEYAGWITGKEKIEALKNTDIFILPSHREGMPNALLEAMASRLPVIATKVGGIPELIENNISGILVEEHNPPQLADALLTLLNSQEKRIEIGRNAQESINKNNSIEEAINKLRPLLNSSRKNVNI